MRVQGESYALLALASIGRRGYVGIERNFFSSDCGNPDYPPVEDGLAIWADRLLEARFGDDEIREMVVTNSRRLAISAGGGNG